MKRVTVEVNFQVTVNMPETENAVLDEDAAIRFDIEENHCAGTGSVGAEIDRLIAAHDAAGTCWGCAVDSECRVISIEDVA